jgi:hypothetical protein
MEVLSYAVSGARRPADLGSDREKFVFPKFVKPALDRVGGDAVPLAGVLRRQEKLGVSGERHQQSHLSGHLQLLVPTLGEVGKGQREKAAIAPIRPHVLLPGAILLEQEDPAKPLVTLAPDQSLLLQPSPVLRDGRLRAGGLRHCQSSRPSHCGEADIPRVLSGHAVQQQDHVQRPCTPGRHKGGKGRLLVDPFRILEKRAADRG